MPYATQTDIERAAGGPERLVELADWDHNGTVNPDAIAFAQESADGWIDSFAALRYATPIANPSRTIINFAAEEAIYRLKLARNAVSEADEGLREVRMEWLQMLSVGKVRPSDPTPTASSAVAARIVVNTRDVSRNALKGYW